MAHVFAYPTAERGFVLERDDFTVEVDETTGRATLFFPIIRVELSGEGSADTLVTWILRDIDMAERLGT